MSALSLTYAQQQFTATLSAVEDAVHFAFRGRLRPQEYEETLAEARAAAWSAWHGLIRKGKDPLAVGITGIANNAIRYVRAGRRVGNTTCGPGAMDVFRKAQKARDFKVVSLDSNDQFIPGSLVGTWKEWLACDHRVGPADSAAFRIDLAAWLGGLPEKKRRVAELLAEGHEPGLVARIVGVSPARVSQLRHELEAGWRAFEGEATPVATVPV
jgi:DNA-directed RNA polymerase specialized sigma24 family protein